MNNHAVAGIDKIVCLFQANISKL